MNDDIFRLRQAVQTLRDDLLDGSRAGTAPDAVHVLDRSVLRPLDELLTAAGTEPSPPLPDTAVRSDVIEAVWQLALNATRLRARPGAAHQLIEATAALQRLALAAAGPEGRRDELRRLQAELPVDIQVVPNGPYLLTNVDVSDWLGSPVTVGPQAALCRCGASAAKPFCDGSHTEAGFEDAKSLDRPPDRRDTYPGQQVTVYDNRGVCQHSGLCTDRLPTAFHTASEPFVAPSGGRMDELIRAVRDCPSGALSFAIDGVEARATVDHHNARPPAVTVTRDGPYRVTGAPPLRDGVGNDVDRNAGVSREHYALCRCGHSQNKPFCSGMHWYVDFHDPVPASDHTPSIFEWCGGAPALRRMTELFYEKFVPQDPLLAELFGSMSTDHAERVAAWLGEVFGGPPAYSSQYGGYSRMLSQHLGKCLTEEHRARWVSLLLQSAKEAGLPNDAEFRSAFQAYIEWGSRLAVENSQTTARPLQHMPMPHWDWTTAAGPPGNRISALAPPAEEETAAVPQPAPDEVVSFATHIKGLFRSQDRKLMSFAFDLWSYHDVRQHATAILDRIRSGSMPCDGAWPAERIEVLDRWIQAGMQP